MQTETTTETIQNQQANRSAPPRPPTTDLEIPTAEEIFDKPYPPAPPIPPAWEGDSIAVRLVDQEIAAIISVELGDENSDAKTEHTAEASAPSISQMLIQLACENVGLFHNAAGDCFA